MKTQLTRTATQIALVCLTTLGLAHLNLDANDGAKQTPNVVLILADDMGYDAVSANNPHTGALKTPNIDRLMSQGMRFTDAHSASSVCTPTRYGLLTGRYCWRTELKKEVLWDYGRPLIEPERLTVAELLQQSGYVTGMVGKWHLGMDWYDSEGKLANADLQIEDAVWKKGPPRERVLACAERIDFSKAITGGPIDHGFDYYFGVDLPNFPPYAWISQDRLTAIPNVPKPDDMFGTEGPMVEGWKLEEILPTLASKSAEWIEEQAKSEQPFFLYVPLTSPHTPIAPSEAFKGKSDTTEFVDFVIETDWVVGHIVEALERSGVADDTLVIFTTDNGTASAARFKQLASHGVNLKHNFSGHKSMIQEGGHRVPFVVRWPDRVRADSSCDDVICLNDFMATMADLLDVELPANAAEDSTSILPLLLSEKKRLTDRPMVVNHDYRGNFAIRDGDWKLTLLDKPLLYNLAEDPKEKSDLSKKHPETMKHMQQRLNDYKLSGRSR